MSKGPTGSRPSGTTIVPSFRFNKADDQMVEVTPSSSFDDMEEDIKLNIIIFIEATLASLW